MKFLADMGVALSTVQVLRDQGHDVVHVRGFGAPRMPDPEILRRARDDGRFVLTFDLDFGDLLAAGGDAGPSVVILRTSNQTPASVNPKLLQVLGQCSTDLDQGAIVVVEDARYRVRRLPVRSG